MHIRCISIACVGFDPDFYERLVDLESEQQRISAAYGRPHPHVPTGIPPPFLPTNPKSHITHFPPEPALDPVPSSSGLKQEEDHDELSQDDGSPISKILVKPRSPSQPMQPHFDLDDAGEQAASDPAEDASDDAIQDAFRAWKRESRTLRTLLPQLIAERSRLRAENARLAERLATVDEREAALKAEIDQLKVCSG